LDPNKNSGAIGSAWDTDTITLAPSTDTIDLSSVSCDYSDIPALTISDLTSMSTTYWPSANIAWPTGSVTMPSTVSISNGGFTIGPNTVSNTVWTTNTTAGAQLNQSGKVSLQGENADLDINGKSLKGWMERVEERLNILTPNPELEKEWDDLRRLGERYRKLEKKCKEKAEVWKRLKQMPPPKL